MTIDLLQLGLSGLLASQYGLNTTSHNIANASTPGYNRQSVVFGSSTPVYSGGSYLGTGVSVTEIRRSYDQFLTRELHMATSGAADHGVQHALAAELDLLLGSPETGLSSVLQGFFGALEDAAADPASLASRQLVIDEANRLAGRFRSLDARFQQAHEGIRASARTTVEEINALVQGIADLDRRIASLGSGSGQPHDLLDQRDELLRQLSERVAVTAVAQDDGSLNLFVGTGQALLVGGQARRLEVTDAPSGTGIAIVDPNGSRLDVTGHLGGGVLGGMLAFEQGLLADAQRMIGQMALAVSDQLNAQHAQGMDLDGAIGGLFFTDINDPALTLARASADPSNTGSAALAVTLDDPSQLQNSDYRLSFDGTDYRLVRARDNQLIGTFAALPQTFAGEGFSIDLAAGAMAAGDSFTIRPAAGAAGGMEPAVADPESLAFASPVRSGADAGNLGDGTIGSVSIDGFAGVTLGAPVTLTYDAAGGQLLVSAPPGGSIPYDPATDSGSTLTLPVPGFGDLSFSISATPADGDVFRIEGNDGGSGDNTNLLALSALQEEAVLYGGTATFAQGYERTVSDVASRTHGLAVSLDAQEQVLTRAEDQRQAQSGVNLDEEAAKLLEYQQAYDASARVISVANELFQTLLRATGG